jgi:hypothetical protein
MTTRISILIIVSPLLVFISDIQSARGAVLEAWVQLYNGPTNGYDYPIGVAVDARGDVVVAGYSGGSFYTAKYAGTTGALRWEQRSSQPLNGYHEAAALALDQIGNAIVTGGSLNGGESQFYTAKYAAADGALLWEKRYDGLGGRGARATALAVDGEGNVAVSGPLRSDDSIESLDYYTAKYAAADGALLWENRYRGPRDDHPWALAIDSTGNVVVTGWSHRLSGPGRLDYYTAKYAAKDGALVWEQRYHGPGDTEDTARAVAVDHNGNVVVTGSSGGAYYTAKYAAADGTLLWEKRYRGSTSTQWDDATAVAIDANGDVVVTGYSWNSAGNTDYYTAKYAAADGALLWEKRYNSSGNGGDAAGAVVVDRHGNVVVTGSSRATADFYSSDYYTAKYAAADGALLWEQRYNGPANQMDGAGRLAIGNNGMIVVAGSVNVASNSPTSGDFTTIAYREEMSPLSIERASTGLCIRLTGFPNRAYQIERANSVAGPWSIVGTITAPTQGAIEYIDTNQPTGSVFYRARTQ